MGFESIIEKVNSLPPLPESVQEIQLLFAKGDPDIKKVVQIIEKDPILTADILGKVNAPFYGLRNNIVSLTQAITLFGAVTIRGFVYSSSAYRGFDIDMRPYGVSNARFKDLCNMQSALMFQWYMGIDVERAKSLIPIAFLLETGKVIIAQELLHSEYSELFMESIQTTDSISEVENEFAGITTAGVNALLFEHWNFDREFIDSMRYLDEEGEIPPEVKPDIDALRIVRTCINIKEGISDATITKAMEMAERLQLRPELLEHAARRLMEKYGEQ